MKKPFFLFVSLIFSLNLFAQRTTATDGDWSKQFMILKKTAEADLMIRVGDIDNLGFSFPEDYNPFSGRSTYSHSFPWDVNKTDAKGTDKIMVPSSYKNFNAVNQDGYTGSTKRPANNPSAISIPLAEVKAVKIDSAALQFFIDDFQAPSMGSKFQVKINGLRFTEAEKMINRIDQTGPVGKLITIRLTPELLAKLNADSLIITIDDPTSKIGDGFALDFVKLLINPKMIYTGKVQGRIIDATTREPIANATAGIEGYGMATSDAEGNFILENIPAGLNIVKGSAEGYSSDEKQIDVISEETSEPVELELKRSGKVNFNNKTLQEGDNLVMNNIQFEVNSAKLLPAGKTELDKLAALMKDNPGIEILLSGHTSAEGAAALNRELSLKRVRSCKDYLAAKGIDEERITIKGYGPDMPIAPNDTEANRAKNRRVELKVTRL
ncbi:MAG TPA: OmpA family protein [Chitinophagaceae bacterium]|nr:OmpA family protein [Chitinophagaceae bacterium]HNU14661.1 OmpA family protein [Chitinophagaceae bacterium]